MYSATPFAEIENFDEFVSLKQIKNWWVLKTNFEQQHELDTYEGNQLS